MSHPQNDEWLESAQEHFEGAIEEGNYALAKDVIADVQDKGFLDGARAMNETLRTTPVENWKPSSPSQD